MHFSYILTKNKRNGCDVEDFEEKKRTHFRFCDKEEEI